MEVNAIQEVQLSQPQANQSIYSNSWTRFILLTILELLIIAGSLFLGIQIGKNQSSKNNLVNTQTNNTTPKITVIGVIRTSGLSNEEKQLFGLPSVSYQLTDLRSNVIQEIYGYYLIPNNKKLETFLGKCVQITGSEPLEWKGKNKNDFYQRTALNLLTINSVDISECDPYSATNVRSELESEKVTFYGTINNTNRPSPDINYDYQILLSKPYLEKENSSGLSQEVNTIVVIPSTFEVWDTLTNNINQMVKIEGYMEWGYAESKYLKIVSIETITE